MAILYKQGFIGLIFVYHLVMSYFPLTWGLAMNWTQHSGSLLTRCRRFYARQPSAEGQQTHSPRTDLTRLRRAIARRPGQPRSRADVGQCHYDWQLAHPIRSVKICSLKFKEQKYSPYYNVTQMCGINFVIKCVTMLQIFTAASPAPETDLLSVDSLRTRPLWRCSLEPVEPLGLLLHMTPSVQN